MATPKGLSIRGVTSNFAPKPAPDRGPWLPWGVLALGAVLVFGGTTGALAQGDGAPALDSSDYNIDVYNGVALSSGRVVGMGGAYTALAEGIDGVPWNPAAYGARPLWELSWFEWEVTASILFPGAFSGDDFYNSGRTSGVALDNSLFLSAGGRVQFGPVGLGALLRTQIIELRAPDGQPVAANLTTLNLGFARGYFDGQLVVGAGLRAVAFAIETSPGSELVSFTGSGLEAGLLVRPADQPWRLGAAARTPVNSDDISGSGVRNDDGVLTAAGFVLPREVHVPWELQGGFALQLGERPLNARWKNPRARARRFRDQYTLRQWRRELAQVRREGACPPGTEAQQNALDGSQNASQGAEKNALDGSQEASHNASQQNALDGSQNASQGAEKNALDGSHNASQNASQGAEENALDGSQNACQEAEENALDGSQNASQGAEKNALDPFLWLPRRAQDRAFWRSEHKRRRAEYRRLNRRIARGKAADRRAVQELSRLYVLLSVDVLIAGPTKDGVGVEGFLAQQRDRSGRRVTVQPRFGAETEPWPGRIKTRLGTYLEPSRFDGRSARAHFTGSMDLRLFTWNLFGLVKDFDLRLGASFDVAPRYIDGGFSIGTWH